MSMYTNGMNKYGDYFYVLFRILVGLMFLIHGGQKLFGWFGGPGGKGSVPLASLFGAAGVIETFVGLMLILGFFTRLFATLGAVEMLVAFFKAHFPNGWIPLLNGGELALLYFAAFLVIMVYGSRKWSLEQSLLKKEVF